MSSRSHLVDHANLAGGIWVVRCMITMANDRKYASEGARSTHYRPFANPPDSLHVTYSSIQQRTQT